MSNSDASKRLVEFCKVTGREPSTNAELASQLEEVYANFLPHTGVKTPAVPTVLVNDRSQQVLYAGGPIGGIILDETYLLNYASLLEQLVRTESSIDIAVPFVKATASALRSCGAPVAALMLRHERVSGLYGIESLEHEIRALANCDQFLNSQDALLHAAENRWLLWSIAYLVLHEIGHWLYNEHAHQGSLDNVISGIEEAAQLLRSDAPLLPRFSAKFGSEVTETDFDQLFRSNVVEESFCDRFASAVFYFHFKEDGLAWTECFVLLRCLQEAKRLMKRSREYAELLISGGQLPIGVPDVHKASLGRAVSTLHLRAYFSSLSLQSIVSQVYGAEFDTSNVQEVSDRLMNQSFLVFTQVAGPIVERTLILLLRAVRAKSNDPDVFGFFDKMVQRYSITESDVARAAFDKVVDEVSQDLINEPF